MSKLQGLRLIEVVYGVWSELTYEEMRPMQNSRAPESRACSWDAHNYTAPWKTSSCEDNKFVKLRPS